MTRSAAALFEELMAVDESVHIEAKTASRIDRSALETICAFANEPGLGGGHLLLGVAPTPQEGLFGGRSYEIVGVENPDKLQSDLASQCATAFNRPVRPQISVDRIGDKVVLVVFIPELAPTEKPLFLTRLGLPRGAYRRVGSTDQEGTEDDLIALYQGHQGETFDGSVVADAELSDLDAEAIRAYRELRAKANPVAEELAWSDAELLRAVGAVVITEGGLRPTVAGMLLFGTPMALRRCFPMMRIDYVRIPGREWVQNPDRRFDTTEIRAPLLLATRRAIAAVRDDLPASFSLPEGETIRSDETVLPIRVLREAIVNAVMHRSYRIHGAIQILRYANRLEIRNPGHSLKAEDQLGEPGSQTRNPRIAAVLHDIHLAETKGSGIRAMRELMLSHDLLPPTFESTRRPDQFVATLLFHHFLGSADLTWLGTLTTERLSDEEARALVFVREVGAIDNAAYRSINRTETLHASAHLRRLRDLGLLKMKGSGSRTYYVPGPAFVTPSRAAGDPHKLDAEPHKLDAEPHKLDAEPHKLDAEPHKLDAEPHKLDAEPHKLDAEPHKLDPKHALPAELERTLQSLGKRPPRPVVEDILVALCSWRPCSARELAWWLNDRDPRQLTRSYLRQMVDEGRLSHTIPEMPNHPNQKYTVSAADADTEREPPADE